MGEELLREIDRVSDDLAGNKKDVYDNMGKLLELIGTVLDDCISNIDKINESGYQVDKNSIMWLVERLEDGLNHRDNICLIDILCFELYGLIQAYVEGMGDKYNGK